MAANLTYGIVGLADIAGDQLLSDLGRDRIQNVVEVNLAQHNRDVEQLIEVFAERTTEYTGKLLLGGNGKLQGTDENGRARPIKGSATNLAFPILQGGTAWGSNYVTLKKMSVQRFAQLTANMMQRDFASIRDLLFAGLFYNLNWTFKEDEYGADITVKVLANADTDTYPKTGATDVATDTHYLALPGTISDGNNPFALLKAALLEHPDNTGDIVAFIPTGLEATTRALTEFVPVVDPNVTPGASAARVSGSPTIDIPGTLIGYLQTSQTWVSVARTAPAGYIAAITEGGPRPLKFREDVQESLQGFGPVGERNEFPFFEEQWQRRCGVGANNRVGAAVLQMGAGGYSVPSGVNPKSL